MTEGEAGMTEGWGGNDLGVGDGTLIVDYVVDSRLKMSGMTEGGGGDGFGVG